MFESSSTSIANEKCKNQNDKEQRFENEAKTIEKKKMQETLLQCIEKSKKGKIQQKKPKNESEKKNFEKTALKLKELGNSCFTEGDHHGAIQNYSESLDYHMSHLTLSNRSISHLKLENYEEVIHDSTEALAIDNFHQKSRFNRAKAYKIIGCNYLSACDYSTYLNHDKSNPEAKDELAALRSKLSRDELEKLKNMCNQPHFDDDFQFYNEDLDKNFEKKIISNSNFKKLLYDEFVNHKKEGDSYISLSQYALALDKFLNAIEKLNQVALIDDNNKNEYDDDYVDALLNIAFCYHIEDNQKIVIKLTKDIINYKTTHFHIKFCALELRAEAYYKLGKMVKHDTILNELEALSLQNKKNSATHIVADLIKKRKNARSSENVIQLMNNNNFQNDYINTPLEGYKNESNSLNGESSEIKIKENSVSYELNNNLANPRIKEIKFNEISKADLELYKKKLEKNKSDGNSCLNDNKILDAIKTYTLGIELAEKNFSNQLPISLFDIYCFLLVNRGLAYMKQGMYEECITDCTKALKINPKLEKAYYRRAKSIKEKELKHEKNQENSKKTDTDIKKKIKLFDSAIQDLDNINNNEEAIKEKKFLESEIQKLKKKLEELEKVKELALESLLNETKINLVNKKELPQSMEQFSSEISNFSDDFESLAQYLNKFSFENIKKITQQNELKTQLLTKLVDAYNSKKIDPKKIFSHLQAISSSKRINISCKFLNKKEKENFTDLLMYLKDKLKENAKEVEEMIVKFHL